MRDIGLWSDLIPSDEALASTQPFAVDTLEFVEWLQFIFLPRMKNLVETGSPLPSNCGIAPMAEEYFNRKRHQANDGQETGSETKNCDVLLLIDQLGLIDFLLSGDHQ